ncbi:C6 zinc finger domain protein [Talaromyces proteolyticus]|uniref:C6 zinc finger domain protein n=1 Tax=Talaromyces proteolyticus TaxID=1131652 RepID=A0AAD4Q5B4_9EURO|nr:C6 zinc finger domain protein [Talaromyces proteolyticus]KAH8704061.1 C6 zinc finger domain protein [Talaromyces proteolyticus]
MGRSSIHPSQRRFSCELCRKHKSRCQRIQRYDLKCARCTILGAECIRGQQKKVGRPKQTAASAHDASKVPGFKSRSTVKVSRSKTFDQQSQQSQFNSPGRSGESPSFPGIHDQVGWSSTTSPAAAPVLAPSRVTASYDASVPTPTIGMSSFCQGLLSPNTTNASHDDYPLLCFGSAAFDSTAVDALSLVRVVNSVNCTPTTLIVPGQERPVGGIEISDAIAKLSKINLDLHIRMAAIEKNRMIVDLNSLIYRESPLFIENDTVAVFMLKTSQDFVLILTRLLNSRHCLPEPVPPRLQSYQYNYHNSTPASSLPYPSVASQPLLTPLALAITSIFTQLISLCELFLEHLTTRIERLSTNPIAPIPGITFGGSPLAEPCMQGMLFSNGVVHLLETMERVLGISEPGSSKVGLLSARQIEVLWSELDGRVGVTRDHGTMRPAHVKNLLQRIATVLSRLSMSNK